LSAAAGLTIFRRVSQTDDDTSAAQAPVAEGDVPSETAATEAVPPGQAPEAAPSAADEYAALAAERDKLRDQLLRTAADFDNYRKRARKDVEDAGRRGREEAVRELLPVADNLERAIAAAATAGADSAALIEGVRMVLRLMTDTLDRLGVTRVPSVGERFDPTMHEAIQQVETADQPPGTIVAELMPGYRIGDRLLRAAMVAVAKAPAAQGHAETDAPS
jgi:molecular chaperone GrpE